MHLPIYVPTYVHVPQSCTYLCMYLHMYHNHAPTYLCTYICTTIMHLPIYVPTYLCPYLCTIIMHLPIYVLTYVPICVKWVVSLLVWRASSLCCPGWPRRRHFPESTWTWTGTSSRTPSWRPNFFRKEKLYNSASGIRPGAYVIKLDFPLNWNNKNKPFLN